MSNEGILLVNKPASKSSFYLVSVLRRISGIKKIGHCGTLDPFATGVMVMLLGKNYTRKSQLLSGQDKEYETTLKLGEATDSFDIDGKTTHTSDSIPTLDQIKNALQDFQGSIEQIPPMFSAKKQNGKRLYELARKGQTVERPPVQVQMQCDILDYSYPELKLSIRCSKGTYVRSIGHDLGVKLGCYAHLTHLVRTKSGPYSLNECLALDQINPQNYSQHLRKVES